MCYCLCHSDSPVKEHMIHNVKGKTMWRAKYNAEGKIHHTIISYLRENTQNLKVIGNIHIPLSENALYEANRLYESVNMSQNFYFVF